MRAVLIWTLIYLISVLGPARTIAGGNVSEIAHQSEEKILIHAISLPEMDEAQFYKLVEQETNRLLKQIEPMLLEEEIKGITKIKQKALKAFKTLNLWGHTKHLLVTHGIGVAITSLISEVVTILILPPILLSAGLNLAAAAIGGIPSPTYMIPTYLALKKLREKQKLGKTLGYSLKEMLQLDKVRRELLGLSIDQRVMHIMLKTLDGDHEINVIRRKFARWRSGPNSGIVDIYEIEDIIKNAGKKRNLGIYKEFAHGDDRVYVALLMNEINSNAEMKIDFHNKVQLRLSDKVFPGLSDHEHSRLFKIHEKLQVIEVYRKKLREYKTLMKNEIKSQGLDVQKEMKIIEQHISQMLVDLENLEFDIKSFEYRYLARIKDTDDFTQIKFGDEIWQMIKRLHLIKRDIDRNGFKPNGAINYSNQTRLRRYLNKLDFLNVEWDAKVTLKTTQANCHEVMTQFLLSL